MPRFEFYLHDLSFQYQEGITLPQLHERIEHLASDCQVIREQGKETIFRCDSIYEISIFKQQSIMDVIWPNTELLGRDQRLYLQLVIDHSTSTTLSNDEIIELLTEHDEDLVNGLLCLHRIESALIPDEHLVYSENDWRKFHRHFLGVYPATPNYFLQECGKCFPHLHFHERNGHTLGSFKEGYTVFARTIVKALGYLNDDFRRYLNTGDVPGSLKAFSSVSGFETTNEGELSRKPSFTFDFTSSTGNVESVCCEPHIKISRSDSAGDNTFYFYRIYFHFGKASISEGRILVGHIGAHL
jgi:hypothetical protein